MSTNPPVTELDAKLFLLQVADVRKDVGDLAAVDLTTVSGINFAQRLYPRLAADLEVVFV